MSAEDRERADAERRERLRERGLPPETWSARLRDSLDLAAGKRTRFHQEPTDFFYPGLPEVQFFDPAEFSWAPEVEAAAPAIREELEQLIATSSEDFQAYIEDHVDAASLGANQALLGNKDWSVLFLCQNGWINPDVVKRCPVTWETILKTSLPRVAGWGPTIVFSQLKAGARIAAHTGMVNTRLICHLPLIVPPDCGFRVGNEVRRWEEGKLLIFDDTIEHEAWNNSADDRIVLIFDVWRPELTEREKYELTALFSD